MSEPALISNRLVLRPYFASMVTDQHVYWLNDPVVMQYSENRNVQHTIESQHKYLNGFNRTSEHIWLITHHTDAIGSISAYVDRPNKVANMGIMIGEKDEWRKGYGSEAWLAVMDWLWSQDMRKIEAGCMDKNRAQRALCAKVGMKIEGIQMGHFLMDGLSHDLLHYGVFRP